MAPRAWYPRCRVVLQVLLEDFAGGADSTVHTYEVVPRSIEVERNPPREADSFVLELDYRDLPLDPRTVRGVLVAVYLGTVTDPAADLPLDDTRYRVFLGTVDEPATSLQENGETVTLKGRDYTSYFLDYRWPQAVDVAKPLSSVVSEILASTPGAASGITVVFEGAVSTKTLSTLTGRKKWTPAKNDDAWTVLSSLCGLAGGYLPVIELDKPRLTTTEALGQRQATLLYGENLSRLDFKRQYKEARSGFAEVRCWDEQKRKLLTARYPVTQATKKKKVGANGKAAEEAEPLLFHFVSGSYTAADLQAMAQHLWEEAARSQLEGTLETRDLADADDATDLWLLAAGDSVVVTLGKWDPAAISGMSDGEALAALTADPPGLDPAVASALIAALRKANGLATTFLVTRATHKWSRDDGYSLAVEFTNYIGV